MFYSRHSENPTLYDQVTGEMTVQGERTMTTLHALTGVRKIRLLDGKAAKAEGVIYTNWDDSIHLIYADQVPPCARYVAGVDWGFTNPGVIAVFGIDGDGRMYLVAQIYRRQETIDWWAEKAKDLRDEFSIEVFTCDPSEPGYIAQFRKLGVNAIPADNSVRPGIDVVQRRLAIYGDGRSRLYVVRESSRHRDEDLITAHRSYSAEQEFNSYVWKDNAQKEMPVKVGDHGMDAIRYAAMYVNSGEGEEPEVGNLAALMAQAATREALPSGMVDAPARQVLAQADPFVAQAILRGHDPRDAQTREEQVPGDPGSLRTARMGGDPTHQAGQTSGQRIYASGTPSPGDYLPSQSPTHQADNTHGRIDSNHHGNVVTLLYIGPRPSLIISLDGKPYVVNAGWSKEVDPELAKQVIEGLPTLFKMEIA